MKDTEQKTVRFYANNPKHKEAWEYLHQLDKEICSSQQDFIIDAINSYYHKMADLKDDPYMETREREEEFIKRITHGVMEQLTADLPKVVGGFLIGLLAGETDGVITGSSRVSFEISIVSRFVFSVFNSFLLKG